MYENITVVQNFPPTYTKFHYFPRSLLAYPTYNTHMSPIKKMPLHFTKRQTVIQFNTW